MSEQVAVPEHYKLAHCLAFVYLTFSAYTDDCVNEAEVDVINKKLDEWDFIDNAPGLLAEVYDFWKGLNSQQTIAIFQAMVAFVKAQTTEKHRGAIYRDLEAIALADNVLKDGEVNWLQLLKSDLGV